MPRSGVRSRSVSCAKQAARAADASDKAEAKKRHRERIKREKLEDREWKLVIIRMLENSRKSERLETELCDEKQGAPSLLLVVCVLVGMGWLACHGPTRLPRRKCRPRLYLERYSIPLAPAPNI